MRARLMRMQSMVAAARFCAAALVAFLLSGCESPTGPKGPPYLAIVTSLSTWPGARAPADIRYHIRGSSAANPYDSVVVVQPKDTVILSVGAGEYIVSADSLPTRCVVPKGGTARAIQLTDADNTGVIRYTIECRGLVSLTVATDGVQQDRQYIYRLRNTGTGTERLGTIAANDTLTFDDVGAGRYTVDIGNVAENCTVTSDGGRRQSIAVEPTGGAALAFTVICSDPAHRPRILSLVSGYAQGANIFTMRVYDPDMDIEEYTWDITDCEGNSVLPDKRERIRHSLRSGRGAGSDTVTLVGGYDLALPTDQFIGRCTELRVHDLDNNVSAIAQHRIGSATGPVPFVRFFNASYVGQTGVDLQIAASDPDDDIVGSFVLVRVRDGVLAARDGLPDLGSMDPAGYLGLALPLIPTTGRIKWDDVYSVIVYVIDARGNVARVEDDDLFR